MHHLKILSNKNVNSEIIPGLPLHYKSLFLLKIKFKKTILERKTAQKNELHNNYKTYRYLISALMKRSKQNYCIKYFESILTSIKDT